VTTQGDTALELISIGSILESVVYLTRKAHRRVEVVEGACFYITTIG
jgi:hypothetical protein